MKNTFLEANESEHNRFLLVFLDINLVKHAVIGAGFGVETVYDTHHNQLGHRYHTVKKVVQLNIVNMGNSMFATFACKKFWQVLLF